MVRYSSRVSASGNANAKKRGAPGKKGGRLVKKGGDIAINGAAEIGGSVGNIIDQVKASADEVENIKQELINEDAGVRNLESKSTTGGSVSVGGAKQTKKANRSVSKTLTSNLGSKSTTGGGRTGSIEASSGIEVDPAESDVSDVISGSAEPPADIGSGLNRTESFSVSGGGLFSDSIGDVSGGVLGAKKGGVVAASLQGIIKKMTHNGMIQVLNHMSPQAFHMLQGVAGAHLPQFEGHPLTGIARKTLGGSFTHPRNISKMATRDITRAVSAQQLATALHAEMMEAQKGGDVGGGLLDSLKHGFNRGFEGFKSSLSAGNRIGSVLRGALSTGIQIGQVFSPVIESLFPGSGQLIEAGISSAEALKAGLETGLRAGEALEKGLESISPLVEDEPEVNPDISGSVRPDPSASEVAAELEQAGQTTQRLPPVIQAQLPEKRPAREVTTTVPGPPLIRQQFESTSLGSGLSKAELRILGFA